VSALAVVEVVEVRSYDQIIAEALDAFDRDPHYIEDMVKVAQRVLTKRAVRSRLEAVD
jgi:hypothetical protein